MCTNQPLILSSCVHFCCILAAPDPPKEITHERIDEIGEAIPPEEAAMVQHE